jgi:hypothetical protein
MDPPLDSDPSFLRLTGAAGSRGVVTDRALRRGEVVCAIPCTARHRRPSRHTVQVDETTHVEVGVLATLNHSCDPNLLLDTTRMLAIAARDIAAGEELAYFYPSTEWDMAESFVCRCGSPACLGVIRGARHLPAAVLARYFVNPHVLALRSPRSRRAVQRQKRMR